MACWPVSAHAGKFKNNDARPLIEGFSTDVGQFPRETSLTGSFVVPCHWARLRGMGALRDFVRQRAPMRANCARLNNVLLAADC
jgi:hypothetical protein